MAEDINQDYFFEAERIWMNIPILLLSVVVVTQPYFVTGDFAVIGQHHYVIGQHHYVIG